MIHEKTEFDVIEWINTFFSSTELRIKEDDIKSVLHFALLWNMFESIGCEKSASIRTIQTFIENLFTQGRLNESDFVEFLRYFQDRYLTDGTTNHHFDSLKGSREGQQEKEARESAKTVLENEKITDISSKIKALLYIVYRLRNNLFHGEKKVVTLNYQVDNFNVANKILATVLEKTKP